MRKGCRDRQKQRMEYGTGCVISLLWLGLLGVAGTMGANMVRAQLALAAPPHTTGEQKVGTRCALRFPAQELSNDPPPMEGPVQVRDRVQFHGLTIRYHEEEPTGGSMGSVAAAPAVVLSEWVSFVRCFKGPSLCVGDVVRKFPAVTENEWDWWVERRLALWCGHWDCETTYDANGVFIPQMMCDGDQRVDMRDVAEFQGRVAREW